MMMPDTDLARPRIVVYRSEYEQGVIGLILSIQQTEFGIPVTIKEQPDLQKIPLFYQVDRGNFWVAIVEDRVVGTIALLDLGERGAMSRRGLGRVRMILSRFGWALRDNF